MYLGSRIPKFTFGLNLGVEYKGLDLSVLLQGVAGVTGMLDGFAGWAFRGDGNIQKWQAEGRFDPANPTRYPAYPRLEDLSNSTTPNIVTSDFWTQDASYIRLKNIQLGYTFPKKCYRQPKSVICVCMYRQRILFAGTSINPDGTRKSILPETIIRYWQLIHLV